MIPKRLVYCWFGEGEMSDLNKRCLESWYEKCPDYEIVRLDETTFDVNQHPYSKKAYGLGIWTLITDVARLFYLKEHGGIYLDTDVELHQSPDALLKFEGGFMPMVDEGYFDVYMLGCSSTKYPDVYRAGESGMVSGEMTIPHMNEYIRKHMDYLGEQLYTHGDFNLVGPDYIRWSKEQPLKPTTIATHHFERSWRACSNLEKMNVVTHSDVLPFDIGDKRLEHQLYGGTVIAPIGKLSLSGHVDDAFDIVGKLNYFYNPRVVKVTWPGGGSGKVRSQPEQDRHEGQLEWCDNRV